VENSPPPTNHPAQLNSQYSHLIKPVASINRKALRSLGKCNKETGTYLDTLKAKKSLKSIADAPYPTNISLTLGAELSHHIIKEYKEGREDHRQSAQNSYPSTLNPQLSTDFSWDLHDIQALNAFRSEMFIVAHIQSQDSLKMLKEEASEAIRQGLTFNDFQKNIKLEGFMPDNPYYLRTNFNTAINNSHLAGQWAEFQKDKDIFPYLRYLAVIDGRTRDEHIELHGIVRELNDPFWDTYYPPNGWNCRCSVEQLTKDEAESDMGRIKEPTKQPDKTFRKNTGKDRSIVGRWLDEKHPDRYARGFKNLLLQEWKQMRSAGDTPRFDDSFGLERMNKKELLDFMKSYLGDRIVNDSQGYPIHLSSDKFKKFERYDIEDVRRRTTNLKTIDDTIQNPDEIWLDSNKKRIRYFKKYDKNTLVLVDFVDGKFEYFNIIPNISNTQIDKTRRGFYLGK